MRKLTKNLAITSTETARLELFRMSGAIPQPQPEKPAIFRRPASNEKDSTVTRPLDESPRPTSGQQSDEALVDHESWVEHKKPRVLILDDQPMVGRSLVNGLAYFGYDAVATHQPLEAWGRVRSGDFEVMLIDCAMPEMNGLEFLTHIRDAGVTMPAVLMSGHWKSLDPIEANRLGVTMFIAKPFTLRFLDEVLRMAAGADLKTT